MGTSVLTDIQSLECPAGRRSKVLPLPRAPLIPQQHLCYLCINWSTFMLIVCLLNDSWMTLRREDTPYSRLWGYLLLHVRWATPFYRIFTPPQNRGGVIFSLQFVCVSVCVCMSVYVSGTSCEQNSSRKDAPIWTRFSLNGCFPH